MFGDVRIDKPTTFAKLRALGISKVEVTFSGGNDEGGADGHQAYDAAGEKLDLGNAQAYPHETWNPETRTFGPKTWVVYDNASRNTRPATPSEIQIAELFELLEAPVYETYGSFAGEFHVYGTVTWDVAAGTVVMEKEESVETYEHGEASW